MGRDAWAYRSQQGSPKAMNTTKLITALILAALLTACGGGDYEEEPVTPPPAQCKDRPEVCK